MKINSKMVGFVILLVIFGGILILAALGWWQTSGGGQKNGNHGSGLIITPSLRATVKGFDQAGLALTTNDGQSLFVQLGNSRDNQSLEFAPQVGGNY